jgi:hypothetical protein
VDFFHPKNPTASAGFEPANSDTRGQHAKFWYVTFMFLETYGIEQGVKKINCFQQNLAPPFFSHEERNDLNVKFPNQMTEEC